MRKFIFAAVFCLSAIAASADPVEGVWQTQPGETGGFAHVEITSSSKGMMGVIIATFKDDGTQTQSDEIGRRIIWDMKPRGDGSYAKGKIYAPDTGKTYNSKMQLKSNSVLSVKGCVLGICRGQDWKRVK